MYQLLWHLFQESEFICRLTCSPLNSTNQFELIIGTRSVPCEVKYVISMLWNPEIQKVRYKCPLFNNILSHPPWSRIWDANVNRHSFEYSTSLWNEWSFCCPIHSVPRDRTRIETWKFWRVPLGAMIRIFFTNIRFRSLLSSRVVHI